MEPNGVYMWPAILNPVNEQPGYIVFAVATSPEQARQLVLARFADLNIGEERFERFRRAMEGAEPQRIDLLGNVGVLQISASATLQQ